MNSHLVLRFLHSKLFETETRLKFWKKVASQRKFFIEKNNLFKNDNVLKPSNIWQKFTIQFEILHKARIAIFQLLLTIFSLYQIMMMQVMKNIIFLTILYCLSEAYTRYGRFYNARSTPLRLQHYGPWRSAVSSGNRSPNLC